MLCRGEVEDSQCEEPSLVAQECCSEVYDGTLLRQSPSTARSLEAGNSVLVPYFNSGSSGSSIPRRTSEPAQDSLRG